MQTAGKRLREARKRLGLTLRTFAEPLGVSHSAINEWENGTVSNLSVIHTTAIEQIHGISADWLLTGNGEMFVKKVETCLTRGNRHKTGNPLVYLGYDKPVLIPFAPLSPSIEPGTDIATHDKFRWIPFDKEWFNKRIAIEPVNLFMTEVDGDSMVPTLYPNNFVMIDMSAGSLGFRDGLWAYTLDGVAHIKRVQYSGQNKFLATSDNPSYSPITLEEPVRFIGRIVWSDKRW